MWKEYLASGIRERSKTSGTHWFVYYARMRLRVCKSIDGTLVVEVSSRVVGVHVGASVHSHARSRGYPASTRAIESIAYNI